MTLIKTAAKMVAEANEKITTLSISEAKELLSDDSVQFVDIRDVRELEREGTIPGAFHAPRGMLEFWIDPSSPYFKPVFGKDKTFVFFCQSAWRSALTTATLQEMGLKGVCHLEGGFKGWQAAGGDIVKIPKSQAD